jgi:energy-coupling factor transporter ATP-binding protein EcfA2
LSGAQRDQVYLSFCLALLTAASRHGVWLPLVLDEPFERLDSRATAALAAVLEGFARQGHQIVLFTQRTDAAERLAAVGAEMRDMIDLRRSPVDVVPVYETPAHAVPIVRETPVVTRHTDVPTGEIRRRKKKVVPASRNGDGPDAGHSDAA